MLDVNEAYASKTRSWDGAVNTKLGSAKVIRRRERIRNGPRPKRRPWGYFCGLWEIAPSCVACSRRLHRNQQRHRRMLFSVYLSDIDHLDVHNARGHIMPSWEINFDLHVDTTSITTTVGTVG